MATGDTKTESYLRVAAEGDRDDLPTDTCCNTKTQNLILGVANRIMNVEDEVEELKNNPDVVDVVGTYQDLQAYDTSTLTDKDIIRVLEDSTHDNKSTFYRWNASTNQFDYVGEAGGGVNVVQTIGSSTTDVMSQDATSKLVFNGGSYPLAIRIGNENNTNAMDTISIGAFNTVRNNGSISIGANASAYAGGSVVIGDHAVAHNNGGIALGSYASTGVGNYNIAIGNGAGADSGRSGIVSFKKSSTWKYNSYNHTGYMVLAGVHDGVEANDAATVGQLDGRVKQNAGAPTTATVGAVGQLLEDTTNGKLYQCTAVDTTDPDNPSYTWDEVGGGGGGTLYGTVGQNNDGAMTQKATTDMVYSPNAVKNSGASWAQTAGVYIGGYDENGDLFTDPSTGKKDYVWIAPKSTASYRGPQNNAVCINSTTAGPYSVVIEGDASSFNGQSYVTTVGYCGQSDVEGMSTFGYSASANGGGEAFGYYASAIGEKSVAIGHNSIALYAAKHSVALGERAEATREGEVNVGYSNNTSQYHGYNNSQYRVIGGVYDGQLDHDAVTVGQINTLIDAINTATGSSIPHIGA